MCQMFQPHIKTLVADSFLEVREGYSVDRVIADPELNERFLSACLSRGLTQPSGMLNRCLMNLRKASSLRGLKSMRTSFTDQEDYEFASEIAIRMLERRERTSLDHILCEPLLAAQFDQLANELCPGYSSVKYRWAALRLRKLRKLSPELLAHVSPPLEIRRYAVCEIALSSLPSQQGIYLFHNRENTLYVGEAVNLRNRVSKHLDHSDNKQLARWLWEFGVENLFVEIQILDPDTPNRTRKALESELIASRQPLFNIRP